MRLSFENKERTWLESDDNLILAACRELMDEHDMAKMKADKVAAEVRTNLAEYLEKGIVK